MANKAPNKTARSLQIRRRRIAIARNQALKQVKAQKKARSVLNSGNSMLVNNGAMKVKDANKKDLRQRSISLLSTCGIDVSLATLDKDYKSARFSLLKEETGTEILRNLDTKTARNEQYKLLKKERKTLDAKKIALNDAIRVLDDRLSEPRILMNRLINSDYRDDFNSLARRLSALNLTPGSEFIRYFRTYENDYDPRYCPMVLSDRISVPRMSDKTYDVSTLTPIGERS